MNDKITVVIADDHPVLRKGLRQIIETDERLIVLAEADDGAAAIELIENLQPQIAVIDVDMPRMDGFQTAREIQKRRLPVKIVFLTIHSQEDLFHSAMDLGAHGYILKDSAVTEIASGIKAVSEGKFYVSAALTAFLIERRVAQSPSASSPLQSLTAAERRILQMIADYKSSKEIAAELFIHFRTVESHRTNITRKLNLSGYNALLRFALEHKAEL